MTTLVVGASGATGRLLVEQLLGRGHNVKIVVRSPETLPEIVRSHDNLSVIHASVLDLSDTEMAQHVSGCDALASCLGHNVSFKGMYGPLQCQAKPHLVVMPTYVPDQRPRIGIG